jgi:branched-subunit amino acid ABC-type transport system permease component
MLALAKRCACEAVFNGIMFSGYIIAVSLSLQLIYGFTK